MGLLSLMFRFLVLCMGVGGLKGLEHGDLRGLLMFGLAVALWNWRWTLREGPYVVHEAILDGWDFIGRMRRSQ